MARHSDRKLSRSSALRATKSDFKDYKIITVITIITELDTGCLVHPDFVQGQTITHILGVYVYKGE